jgi:Myb-like DNA-binding domain
MHLNEIYTVTNDFTCCISSSFPSPMDLVQDNLPADVEEPNAVDSTAVITCSVDDASLPSCSECPDVSVTESGDIGDDVTAQELLNSSVSEDTPNAELSFKNDFEAFLNFSFPEDNEFSSRGDIMDPFYFESDHVALKGNEDYRRLLRSFVTLESQRTALHDLDELLKLQRKALSDPLRFTDELCRGSLKDKLPAPRRVAELPCIAWERYTSDVESVLSSFGGSHHMTRQKQKRELMNGIRHCVDEPIAAPAPIKIEEPASVDKEVPRPPTFNQAWSAEEQRKLEHLLKKYPPERFESRRWAKIAKELPGRTTQQVHSKI